MDHYLKVKRFAGFVLVEIVSLAVYFLFSPLFLIGLLVYAALTGQIGGD